MTREEAISIIEGLYPADSEYENTAAIGAQLLEQAKSEIQSWKTEPTPVLIRYAQLCMEMEQRETSRILRKNKEKLS